MLMRQHLERLESQLQFAPATEEALDLAAVFAA